MAQIGVSQNSSFEQWLVKTNSLSSLVGDPAKLKTASSTNLVEGVNNINTSVQDKGGVSKNGSGQLQLDRDETTIEVADDRNIVRIKNDGVTKSTLNQNVAGDGLAQSKDEGISVQVDTTLGLDIENDRVKLSKYKMSLDRFKKQTKGSIITYSSTGAPVILEPGTAGNVLSIDDAGDATWQDKEIGNQILAYSGNMFVSRWALYDEVKVTVKCSRNLTGLSNLTPLRGRGSLPTNSTTLIQGKHLFFDWKPDPNFGYMWQTDQGLVVTREIVVMRSALFDGPRGDREILHNGVRLFNDNSGNTFCTFKLITTQGGLGDNFPGTFFATMTEWQHLLFFVELLPDQTGVSSSYYDHEGENAVEEWLPHKNYIIGDMVTSVGHLYDVYEIFDDNQKDWVTTGSLDVPSGDATYRPTHRAWGTTITTTDGVWGVERKGKIGWRFLGDAY